MTRKLLLLLSLAVPLVACGNSHQAEFAAAMRACEDAHPRQVGNMVARASCAHQQRDRYGVHLPSEELARAIVTSYAAKIDSGQISLADGHLAIQRELNVLRQEDVRTAAVLRAANAAESRAHTEQQALDTLRQQQLEQARRPQPTSYEPPHSTNCNIMMLPGGLGQMNCG